MKTSLAVLLSLLTLFLVSGCCGKQTKQPDSRWMLNGTNSAHIEDAFYTGTADSGPNSRKEVIVNGSFFKASGDPDVSDCQTRLPEHPAPSQTNWQNCVEIKKRSGMQYVVVVYHSAAYEKVEIHVRGEDGKFSDAVQIRKD